MQAVLPISNERGTQKLTARPKPLPAVLISSLFALLIAGPALAQEASSSSAQTAPAASSEPAQQKQDPAPKIDPSQAQKAAAAGDKAMTPEEARQAQLVADANKLYELAQELQTEVAKSNKNTLSLAVVKKAAEVEKLAKSLKERMKPE